MACFLFLLCRRIEGCGAHRVKGLCKPRVHATSFVLQEESEENLPKGLGCLIWMLDLAIAGCSVHSTASDAYVPCI